MADNQKIVGDEQVCNAQLLLELLKHVDDLGLNRDVQCGDRLIADDELWVHGKGSCDADTLSLAAGELVGIAGCMLCVQADQLHQVHDLVMSLLLRAVEVMNVQGLSDDVLDGHSGV